MAQEKTQGATAQPTTTENEGTRTQAPQQPQARPCPQDCRLCGMNQQVFCSTKMLFDMSRAIQVMSQQIAAVEKSVADLQAQMQKEEQGGELTLPFSE